MNWPDLVQSIGAAIAAVLIAWQGRTALKVNELQKRVGVLEESNDRLTRKLRVAVQHIREWMTWWRMHHPDTTPPPLPDELRDEV